MLCQLERCHKVCVGRSKPVIVHLLRQILQMTSNPYVDHLIEKGYTERECRSARSPKRTFPCTIGFRTFDTEEEYQNALHDFLNGI